MAPGQPAVPAPKRLARAVAALTALLVALALMSCWGGAAAVGPPSAQDAVMGTMAQQVLDGASAEEALAAQGYGPVGAVEVPEWFAEEVLPAERCASCHAAQGWQVVGFAMPGSADQVMAGLLAELAQRGWCAYESGVANAVTLTKEEGEVRWMMMQCTAIGDSTSVVLQLSRSSC